MNKLKQLMYITTYKKIREKTIDTTYISVNKSNISQFSLSTNPILSFYYNGKLYYFRECVKLGLLEDYFVAAIESFFQIVLLAGINNDNFKQEILIRLDYSDEEIRLFKEYIYNRAKNKNFLKNLARIDKIAIEKRFSIWEKQVYNDAFFRDFGFGDIDNSLKDITIYFLWYMRGSASNYHLQRIVSGNHYSFFYATKSMASQIIAEELGMEELLVRSTWCKIEISDDKTSKFGILSEAALGCRMKDADLFLTSSLQKSLLELQVLDVICYQPDHGPNNYNVYLDNNDYKVCAFDNDNPRTFFPVFSVSMKLAGCSPFVKNGYINRPYLPKNVADSVCNIDLNLLKKRLLPYLNTLQIQAVICRIRKLQRAIKKTQKRNEAFIVDVHQWNEYMIQDELNDQYGVTYLSKIYNKKIRF